jgi:hypothetical protein
VKSCVYRTRPNRFHADEGGRTARPFPAQTAVTTLSQREPIVLGYVEPRRRKSALNNRLIRKSGRGRKHLSEPATFPLRYEASFEQLEKDEEDTDAALTKTMLGISKTTFKDSGRGLRSVHAKSHGF